MRRVLKNTAAFSKDFHTERRQFEFAWCGFGLMSGVRAVTPAWRVTQNPRVAWERARVTVDIVDLNPRNRFVMRPSLRAKD